MKTVLMFSFLLITYLLYFSNFGAIGAVMDTRVIVVIFSISLLLLSIYTIFKRRTLFLNVFLLFSVIITILSIKEYFLTYDEVEIAFQNDGHNFYGSLYTPKSEKPSCLVVFIHGSGSEDRNEYAFHARNLARQGIAGFVYDKRGSGKSEGDVYEVGYRGYAEDAIASIEKIKTQYDFKNIGLFAVSEGEWVSLIVDAKIDIDFIVLISASGTSPLQQTLREMTYRLERKGYNQNDINEARNLYSKILTFDNDSLRRKEIEENINQSKNKSWFEGGEDFSEELYYYPWWSKVMYHDPAPYLEKTTTDILLLVGNENDSYPSEETENNYKKYNNVKLKVFDNGDHSLLDWKFGKGVPPPFFVRGYLETYSEWIIQQCNKN